MDAKWQSLGNGLQSRTHESRKFGRRFDRFIRGRYQVDEKRRFVSLGWESTWVASERARMKAEGETGPRMSFVEHCQGELARLKKNALRGDGPLTLKEDRELAEEKARAEAKAEAEEERQAFTFGEYWKKTYLPAAKISKKANTCRQEKSIFKKWLKPNIGKIRLVDIRRFHIEGIKSKMVKAEKAPEPFSLHSPQQGKCGIMPEATGS